MPPAVGLPDENLTKFLFALRGATVKDIGDDMQLLSLGPDSYFPDDTEQKRNSLLVRDFFDRLVSHISSRRTSLLIGTPGTGKSWWIWYAIHLLLKQEPASAIVWQSFKRGGDCVLFKDGNAFVGKVSTFANELNNTSTW